MRSRDFTTGRDHTEEQLRGVREAEAQQFDARWRAHAEQSLPHAWGTTGQLQGRAAAPRGPALPAPRSSAPRAQQHQQYGGAVPTHPADNSSSWGGGRYV